MKNKYLLFCITVILSVLLSSCAKDLPPGSYDSSEVGKVKKVVPGVIISKRPIHIYAKSTDVKADSDLEAAPGTSVNRKRGYEYVVKLNSGEIVSIAQDEDLKLKVKQHILVIYGENTRIVANEGDHD